MEKTGDQNIKKPKEHDSSGKEPIRRSRIVFTVFMIFLTVFLVWPGYTLFSLPEPLILGLPLSFAWVTFCTIAGFLAMFLLYISDRHNEEDD
jgi:membrane protein implicated in regulation of membrane protease activity